MAQHRSKSQGHGGFGYPSPSRHFRGMNCRAFQTGSGILPTPLKSCTTPEPKKTSSASSKTVLTTPNSNPRTKTRCKTTPGSAPVAIKVKGCKKERIFCENVCDRSFLLSELWAGPTYSNSPPPSSLPIPKFSVKPKRTVSLDLPSSCPKIEMHLMAKSAPCSPRREYSPSASDFLANADSATKTLRRILNLDLDDDE